MEAPESGSASCGDCGSSPVVLWAVEFPMLMSFGSGYWSTVLQWDGRCELVTVHQINREGIEEVRECSQ